MLTDAALRNLKPKSKIYKASDRDWMYVTVSPSGTVTFRYDYCLNGRRETLTLGRYGPGGISLAMARELLLDARKAVLKGTSPALEKQREKRRVVAIKTFGAAMDTWLANARLADSTRAMRKHIIDRDILPVATTARSAMGRAAFKSSGIGSSCPTRPRSRSTIWPALTRPATPAWRMASIGIGIAFSPVRC